jgi:branched-chain amino acid transport system permease protein
LGTLVLQAVVSGVLTGGVYALMAAGLTLIFGVMDIINVAQGILVVLGAYLSYVLSVHLGVDLFLGLLVTVPAMFVIGVLIQWLFISRLGERERTAMSILATYSVAIIIEGVLGLIFGDDYVQLNAWYVNKSFHVLGFYLPYIYVFGFLLAVGLLSALYVMLYRTRFGGSVRATMQDRSAAGRHRRSAGGRHHLRRRGISHRRRRYGIRRHQFVQSQHRVRPHFPPARHSDPGRPG